MCRNTLLRALLASSSVAAMLTGAGAPAWADGCAIDINGVASAGVTNPAATTINCILVTNATVNGNVVNAGTITTVGSETGIAVSGGTFTGSVSNSGTITSGTGHDIAVFNNATFIGGITNSGTLSTSSSAAILVGGENLFTGGVTNSGTITGGSGALGITVQTASSYAGGISNRGTISVSGTGILLERIQTFTGGISNSGTISAASGGIIVGRITGTGTPIPISISTFSGGITNSGTISSSAGPGIEALDVKTFSGGIFNSGIIAAPSKDGIGVNLVSTFSGGITNSGTITAGGGSGIGVSGGLTFSGGITNSGTVSSSVASGISVFNAGTFAGGITNSGTVHAQTLGIFIDTLTFLGGITNSGTIVGITTAVVVSGGSSFSGGISNTGTISGGVGIEVHGVSAFSGGISNGGVINTSVGNGIDIHTMSSFAGGISNSGTISAHSSGIFVGTISTFAGGIINTGTIQGPNADGITVLNTSTFLGGITNSGIVSGSFGVFVSGGSTFSGAIVNSGNITGTADRAIDVSGAPNAMTIDQQGGTISGAIRLSPFADVVNVSGGVINGNIIGQGSSNTINFALGAGTFTYGSGFSISGVNQLNVSSGSVVLEGTNSATNVAVSGGLLEVGDAANTAAVLTATSGVTVASGGTLAGHGTVTGNVAIGAGGTLAPGGSIGTLSITGTLALVSGAFYQVEVDPAGQNSKTVATGAATLSGGTVHVLAQPGTYAPSTTYTILTANGGVTGTFAGVTTNLAFLTPTLTYDADDVLLGLARNATSFASSGGTPNQRSVGAAVDASPAGSAIAQALSTQTGATAQQALDALSGEVHASAETTMIDYTRYLREASLGRVRQASYAGSGSDLSPLALGGPLLATADAAPPLLREGRNLTAWAEAIGAFGHVDGDGNAAAVSDTLGGFLAGVDTRLGQSSLIGVALGYTHGDATSSERASSIKFDTARLGIYGGTAFGAIHLRAGAEYDRHWIDSTRLVAFPGFSDRDTASYGGDTAQTFGEVGYGLAFGRVAVEPFAGIAYVHLHTDQFSETGGAAALSSAATDEDLGYSSLGARVATSVALSGDMALIPHFSAQWQHGIGRLTPTAILTFESTGAAFGVAGAPLARDAAVVETGLDFRISSRATLGLSYSGELAGQSRDNAVRGSFTWSF